MCRGLTAYSTAQNIFLNVEETFRMETLQYALRKSIQDMMKNVNVVCAYNNIVFNIFVDYVLFSNPLLEKILALYLRIRSFSLAKN